MPISGIEKFEETGENSLDTTNKMKCWQLKQSSQKFHALKSSKIFMPFALHLDLQLFLAQLFES